MLLEPILIILTLVVLLIASYTDLKTREVPDFLSWGFLFAVLGIRLIFAAHEGWHILLSGILGFAFAFILAILLYYTHQWGGADSKLLMGMGAMLGIDYPLTMQSLSFPLYLGLVLFIGSVYGLVWMLVVAIKHKTEFSKEFVSQLNHYRIFHYFLSILSLLFLLMALLFSSLYLFVLLPLLFFYLILFVTCVEKTCFEKTVPITSLTEGDWLAENVQIKGRTILKKKTLEKKDLVFLNKLLKEKKLHTILIKEGIPFIPSFLVGYVTFLIISNPVFSFLSKLGRW